jgi:acetolactate decarboxylase
MTDPMQYPMTFGLFACGLALGCAARETVRPDRASARSTLYQYSVLDSLLAGVYDGDMTIGALKQHGDFGLGTFDQLDGEMLVLEGVVYRIRADGSVRVAADDDRTPNGFVTWFRPDQTVVLEGASSMHDLQAQLLQRLRPNRAYAIELRGRFASLMARAPEAATRPYPEFAAQLAAHPHTFPLVNTEGVAVGFLLPPYMSRINVPGLHLHYLANDHAAGGHVLQLTAEPGATARIMEFEGIDIDFNKSPEFDAADLTRDRQNEQRQVETTSPPPQH